MYNDNGRTDDELSATCYIEDTEKGVKKISIDYSLGGVTGYRSSFSNETLATLLRTRCYGALLSHLQENADNEYDTPMPFNPLSEARLALRYDGLYPTIKVDASLLPKQTKPESKAGEMAGAEAGNDALLLEMEEEIQGDGIVDDEDEQDSDRDDERSISGMSYTLGVEEEEGEDEEDEDGVSQFRAYM
jgi:hypothetical protein